MASQQENIRKTLLQFYHNPVATVSLELLLSVGAIIFFALFAIYPTLMTMSDLTKEIEDKKELQGQLERKIAALATVQTEYFQLQNRMAVLDQALPNTPQLVTSLKTIEKLASDEQLIITGITVHEIPEETSTTPKSGEQTRQDLPLTIAVTGDYPTIRQFVETLQSYRRSFVVDTIVFSTAEEGGLVVLNATITVYLPYYTEGSTGATQTPGNQPAAEPEI